MSCLGAFLSQLAPRLCAHIDRGGRGRERRSANGSAGARGRRAQRQLGAGKSREVKATQRQHTEANDNSDGRSDHQDHATPFTVVAMRGGNECAAASRRSLGSNAGTEQQSRPELWLRSGRVWWRTMAQATTHGFWTMLVFLH